MSASAWVVLALMLATSGAFAHRAARSAPREQGDRAGLLAAGAAALVGLALGRAFGPWDLVPPVIWALAVSLAVWGALAGVRGWPSLERVRSRHPTLKLIGVGVELVVAAALVAVLAQG